MSVIFHNVTFGYNEILLKDIQCHFDIGWSAIVGANGAGKTTILQLITGDIQPNIGHISGQAETIYCEQKTERHPKNFEDFLFSYTHDASRLKSKLCITEDWLYRWDTLSHGERKRAQIGTALWQEPSVLAIDEPTNHLDYYAKELLYNALMQFNGIGIIVSHDRDLLDKLPYQCIFLDPPNIKVWPGKISEGKQQQILEEEYARDQKKRLKKQVTKLKRTAAKHRDLACNADKMRSKKGISRKDHDAMAKIDGARVTGKDALHGKLLNQIEGRLKQTEDKYNDVKVKKSKRIYFDFSTAKSKRDYLFKIDQGSIHVGEKLLQYNDLTMYPEDKIAITGNNGSGKSTLIRHILGNIVENNILYIPQEIDSKEQIHFLKKIHSFSNKEKGAIFTVISSLGSDPNRLLYTNQPSPGELRKLMLAMGIVKEPVLIIMDEPTNHMDLPSAECLEQTLKNCNAGLLLVSHGWHFLSALAEKEWNIIQSIDNEKELILCQKYFDSPSHFLS